ncbi:MAG TPA: cytochrome c1, partial [Planctomycetota bacterium]|nr:cytochrome c1 [Planctomycetota bacterium]
KKGKHGFRLGYFQGGGGAELRVAIEGPGLSRRDFPAQALSHSKVYDRAATPASNAPAATFVPDPALVQKGRLLFASKRCASCHVASPDLKAIDAKPLAQLKGEGSCPINSSLSSAQSKAVSAAIGAIAAMPKPDPALRIRRTMAAFNCAACHERDKRGGPSPDRNPLFVTTGDDLGDEGRIPPHLNGVGAKLRREWIQTVLGNGSKVRPYMATRMPVFGTANLGTLAEDFEKADGALAAAPLVREPELVKTGRLLTGTKGMSCVTCHTFQNQKSLGIQGMDLVHMSQRLRRDWFAKYLLDPPSLRPGTRMPTYWPEGKSVRKDILEGNTERQIDALWQYLSEGGKAQIPVGLGPQPIPLAPVDEVLIYRNFIQGAGPRAIAVGYPEKIHLAFDANAMRPALLWRGEFLDASKHWVDRGSGFQGPAGEDVLSLAEGAPFAVLPDPNAPWPKASGHEAGYQFGGYELDKKRKPTFTYTFGQVEVRDTFDAVDAKPHAHFKRILSLSSKEPIAALWFRVATGKKIEERDGVYILDNGLKLKIDGAAPTVRAGELLVPVPLKERGCLISVTYSW